MKTITRILFIALFLALLGACAEPQTEPAFDLSAAKEVIEEKNRQFTEAHVTGEVQVINDYFVDDAKIFAPNSEVVTGREAINALNAEYVGYGISAFTEETRAVYGDAQLLVEEGIYSMTYGEEPTTEEGKYVNVWVPVGDDWKVRANIWNSSMPPS